MRAWQTDHPITSESGKERLSGRVMVPRRCCVMAQDLFESAERHSNMQFEWYREFCESRFVSKRGGLFILHGAVFSFKFINIYSEVNMENILKEVADRIRETRLVCELTEEEMASCTGVTVDHYRALEAGQEDFSFTFIYKCERFFFHIYL